MKKIIVAGLIVTAALLVSQAEAKTASEFSNEWKSLHLGMYVHYGIPTYAEPGNPSELPKASEFNPTQVEARQWALVAKGLGANYVVLTVKHEWGFCLWNSSGYKYDVGSSPARKLDIIGDFVDACEAEGLKAGIHYSVGELYNEGALRNKGPIPRPYFDVLKQHTEELHKKFPRISIHLFDWGNRLLPYQRRELHELIEKKNPDCIVFSGGQGQGLPAGTFIPRQRAATIVQNRTWMWAPNYELTPANALYQKYRSAKSGNANFIISVGPDRSGRIPDDQLIVLEEFKAMMAGKEAPDSAPAPRSPAVAQADGADRNYQEQLKKLKSLYEGGLISKEIYDAKQKELLDSLLSGSSAPAASAKPARSAEPVDLRNGLVLHLDFNKNTGSKTLDASGHDNHGRVRGAKWTREGRIGGAYRFSQKKRTHGIRVEDSDSLDCTAVTMAAWIKSDDAGEGWPRIADKDWKEGYNLALIGISPQGVKRKHHGKGMFEFSEKRWMLTKKSICDGRWHHLAASYGDGKARIYVDGKLISGKTPQNRRPVMVNDFDLMIGNCHPKHEGVEGEKNAFDGIIDEVRIYNRVLTPDEIREVYSAE